jgi:glycosyl hydrolase family 15
MTTGPSIGALGLSLGLDTRPGEVSYWLAGRRRYKHTATLSHLSCGVAAGRRRFLPKLLARRPTILGGHSARRGCVSSSTGVETMEAQRFGALPSFRNVRRACGFLIREGPITAQDRWEEASGYSPSTLAVHIAALICAAEFFDDRGDHGTAEFVRDYADFLESHIERWTVTTEGTLVPGIRQSIWHFLNIGST